MKRYIYILLIFVSQYGFSQQDPIYSQYVFNPASVNPAYSGETENMNIFFISRHQWVSFEGAPSTQTLGADFPLNKQKAGIGAVLISDRLGPVNQTVLYLDYGYRIPVTKKSKLAMGLRAGFSLYDLKLTELYAVEEEDALLTNDLNTKFLFNFGFGIKYYTKDLYISLSAPKLLRNNLSSESDKDNEDARLERHYYIMGGYNMNISRDFIFKPAVVGKIVSGAPLSVDVLLDVEFRKAMNFGVLYRIGDALGLVLQYTFKERLKVGYALEYSLSAMGQNSVGTHEILLSYKFKPKKEVWIKLPGMSRR